MSLRPVPLDLWLILAAYGLLALATSLIVPLAESPDELDHFLYVRYVAENGRFPIMVPVAEENETMEANQPPLYYLLGTAVAGWVDIGEPAEMVQNGCFSFAPQDTGRQHFYWHEADEAFPYQGNALAFHLVRVLSVLLGAGTVGLTYFLGQQLSGGAKKGGLLAAAVLAFNPQFIFITASVNNDVLTAFLGAAILAQSVRVAKAAAWRRVVLLALLVGLGLLTKFALLALWPLPFVALLLPLGRGEPQAAWQHVKKVWSTVAGKMLVLAGLPLLVAGWWYVRAARLYGDPLAWDVHLQAKGAQVLRTSPLTLTDVGEFISLHFRSYWGLFGWLNVQLPSWLYGVYALLVGLAVIGVLLAMKEWWAAGRDLPFWKRLLALLTERVAFVLIVLTVTAVYASLFRYILTINWSGYQGRLAFAAAAAIAALLALGWQRLWRAFKPLVDWLPVVLAVLAVGAVFGTLPAAYPRPAIYQTPADDAVCARFANGLLLEGFMGAAEVRPGEETAVSLYGYGLADVIEPQHIAVELTGRDGLIVAQAERELTWSAGEVVSVTLPLTISPEAAPARGMWQVALPSEATSVNGRLLEMPLRLQTVKIAPERPFVPEPQTITDAVFGDKLALVGYDLFENGSEQIITLYWQALVPLAADYTTFVHLLSADGDLLTQADSQPQAGEYPTSIWTPGEVVADVKVLGLPQERPLRFVVGAYLLETGERLSLPEGLGDGLELRMLGDENK